MINHILYNKLKKHYLKNKKEDNVKYLNHLYSKKYPFKLTDFWNIKNDEWNYIYKEFKGYTQIKDELLNDLKDISFKLNILNDLIQYDNILKKNKKYE